MNILLVQSYLGGTEPLVFPLGLARIAQAAAGHDVEIFDPNAAVNPMEDLSTAIERVKPDVAGISLRNIDSTNKRKVVFFYDYFKTMLAVIRKSLPPAARIIVGGSGFSMFAEKIMADESAIDVGVMTEGERTFQELLANLDAPQNVKGVYYRKDGKVLFTGAREFSGLDELPVPYAANVNIKPYLGIPDAIGVETKRGCPLTCAYCIYGFLNGQQFRLMKPEKVVDDIEFLVTQKNVQSFTFTDSVFNMPLAHAEAICREIIRRKLPVTWSAWFHDSHVTGDFAALAREAGCRKIILSPDGFSDLSLAALGKSQKKADILRTYEILERLDGVEICYNFFKNPPGQSLAAFLGLLMFFVSAKFRLKRRIHFEFSSLRVEPHTHLQKLAVMEGVVSKDDDLLYPRYYTNRRTIYAETLFNMMLRLKGM
jgi:anaerobic magnesium-protoporphyrin IX monomethyl ester cyclase